MRHGTSTDKMGKGFLSREIGWQPAKKPTPLLLDSY